MIWMTVVELLHPDGCGESGCRYLSELLEQFHTGAAGSYFLRDLRHSRRSGEDAVV
jgi:hypothetical protein